MTAGERVMADVACRLNLLRRRRPLIHHITNVVTARISADATLAMGGSPVMARSPREAAEMACSAQALVLNMGTPDDESREAMLTAGAAAAERATPVVFDPVGLGSTSYRAEIARDVMEQVRPQLVRGNRAEILALSGATIAVRGVDGAPVRDDVLQRRGLALAQHSGAVVAATGAVDWVTDGRRERWITGGHPWMGRVVGTGCVASAVTACFAAVGGDLLMAATGALAYCAMAGHGAALCCQGPASFRASFIDNLYSMREDLPGPETWNVHLGAETGGIRSETPS